MKQKAKSFITNKKKPKINLGLLYLRGKKRN